MKYFDTMKSGIITNNPVFVQLLSLCPLLAVTTSAQNGLAMGIATTSVMICASTAISIVRKLIPGEIRVAIAVVMVAGIVTVVEFLLHAFASPAIVEALGIYIPLIVVNCILFARIEAFASKNSLFSSAFDALSYGLGLTLALVTVGLIREFLGKGAFFGFELLHDTSAHMLIMIMPAGAFFTLGTIILALKYMRERKKGNKS